MKTLLKILVFSFFWTSCRKEVERPPANERKNQSFLFIDVDDNKYLIDDKSFNFNKNSKGNLEDFSSYFFPDEIYISINYENTKLNKGFCYGQLWLNCIPSLGQQRPKYIRMTAKLYDGEKTSKKFDFSIANNKNNSQSNNLIDSIVNITDFNIKEKLIEFEFAGNFYDVIDKDTTIRKLKIKAKINF